MSFPLTKLTFRKLISLLSSTLGQDRETRNSISIIRAPFWDRGIHLFCLPRFIFEREGTLIMFPVDQCCSSVWATSWWTNISRYSLWGGGRDSSVGGEREKRKRQSEKESHRVEQIELYLALGTKEEARQFRERAREKIKQCKLLCYWRRRQPHWIVFFLFEL